MNSINDGADNLGMNEKPHGDDIYDGTQSIHSQSLILFPITSDDTNEKKPGTSNHIRNGELSNSEPDSSKFLTNDSLRMQPTRKSAQKSVEH